MTNHNTCHAIIGHPTILGSCHHHRVCGAPAPWRDQSGFSWCDDHKPTGAAMGGVLLRSAPPPSRTVAELERRAAELGCPVDDREAWGTGWPLALARRIDAAIFRRESDAAIQRRRDRERKAVGS